jgi:hypothetical protein
LLRAYCALAAINRQVNKWIISRRRSHSPFCHHGIVCAALISSAHTHTRDFDCALIKYVHECISVIARALNCIILLICNDIFCLRLYIRCARPLFTMLEPKLYSLQSAMTCNYIRKSSIVCVCQVKLYNYLGGKSLH